ncbi:preprotein translocase subunit SecA [Candidatus Gracilibacteria bacterium]|nr:preprotein translocase subunit SecA [Candidatus Gracilibacteria bacterium]
MFEWVLNKLTGDYNQKQIKKIEPILSQINHYYTEFDKLNDDEVKAKTIEFRERLVKGETLDHLLPEAFATVKQACKRMLGQEFDVKGEKIVWNMLPYDVQMIGGIILHKGKIAEMKTGEGKTLVAVMPVYLNALSGKGVHVVTVNDYLASRDAQWMGHVYQRLGLTIGTVTKGVPVNKRKEEYSKDITYVENSELGFDYLRDNLTKTFASRSLIRRPLNYAIVDEIDSILIDEARTPLIISEAREEPTEKYVYYGKIVKLLTQCSTKKVVSKGLLQELLKEIPKDQEEDGDYYIDEKTKSVLLSGRGIKKLEGILGVENLYKDLGIEEIHHIENALRAHAVYEIDKEYIVKDGEVLIVDEHTGRTMPGRRFSEGLHQAIEAKEGVTIQRESQTMATITYQNFFKQYNKLGGMTGTATTEAEEFIKIYELDTLEVPTNKPIIRVDKNDKVYFNQSAKWKFVKEHIKFYHEMGQPILIGTANIMTSEYVSRMLEKETINHYVLNAKFHEQEANIVTNAGKFKSVVVATNMAGRGTDIKLEKGLNDKIAENYAKWIKKQLKSEKSVVINIFSDTEFELTIEGLKKEWKLNDETIREMESKEITIDGTIIKLIFNKNKKLNTDRFVKLSFKNVDGKNGESIEKEIHYGLFILGTEKHESRRIDNQLRGRAGRQGDPGTSVFFVALDDLIMKKMGGERIQGMAKVFLSKDDLENLELTQKQFTSSIEKSQKQMEAWNFGIRKHLFDYDSVIDKQRKRIYKKRDDIIESELDQAKKDEFVVNMMGEIKANIYEIVNNQVIDAQRMKQSNEDLLENLSKQFGLKWNEIQYKEMLSLNNENLVDQISQNLERFFDGNIKKIDQQKAYLIFKEIYLHHMDMLRVEHLDNMQYLRDKVGFMGYAQMDPLVMYKKEAFDTFQSLIYRLKMAITTDTLSIDYSRIAMQEEMEKMLLEKSKKDPNLVKMLQEASSNIKESEVLKAQQASQKAKKAVFQDEDGFEVFEINEETQGGVKTNIIENKTDKDSRARLFEVNEVKDVGVNKKLRPNDVCYCGSGKKFKKCHGVK